MKFPAYGLHASIKQTHSVCSSIISFYLAISDNVRHSDPRGETRLHWEEGACGVQDKVRLKQKQKMSQIKKAREMGGWVQREGRAMK